MSIPDTPVWSFRPNWANDIVERWEWLTDAPAGDTGVEQRIAVRYAPRRSVEATYLATGREQAYLNLALQRAGTARWLVPLWFHAARLTAAVSGAATTLPCDTVNREFEGGDFALLLGADAFTCEVVEIDSVAAGSLTLASGVTSAWPSGTRLFPLREGWIESAQSSAPTDTVSSLSMRATFDQGNAVDGGSETLTLFEGTPLLTQRPDWAQSLTRGFEWLVVEHDSEVGIIHRTDPAGRAFQSIKYGIQLHGRAEQAAFRALLLRVRGRQKALWVPAYVNDLRVAVGASLGASALEIDNIGLSVLGGITDDVATVLLSGNLPLRATSMGTASSAAREKLNLSATLSRAVAAGEPGCFLHYARLDQDVVTITHRTDSDGVATVPLTWRAVPNTRDGSAAGYYPIPTAEMTEGGCCDADTPGDPCDHVLLDFLNQNYTINGATVAATDILPDLTDEVEDAIGFHLHAEGALESWQYHLDLSPDAYAAVIAADAAAGFTAIIEYSLSASGTGAVSTFSLQFTDTPTSAGFYTFNPGVQPSTDISLLGSYSGSGFPATTSVSIGGAGTHKSAVTLSDGSLAVSTDGSAAAQQTPPTNAATPDRVALAFNVTPNEFGSVSDLVITKIHFVCPQAASDLPTASTP